MATKFYTEQKKTNNKSSANKNDASMKPSTSRSTSVGSTSSALNDTKIQDMCITEGCNKIAVSHLEWDNEYCSVECCYNHCKKTFQAWLTANKIANAKLNATASSAQECVAGPSHQNESVKP